MFKKKKKHLWESNWDLGASIRTYIRAVWSHFGSHLVQLFRRLQCCFAVKLQKCFMDYKTSAIITFILGGGVVL